MSDSPRVPYREYWAFRFAGVLRVPKPTDEELARRQRRCLEEHLPYERKMLGYAFERLHDTEPGLAWNMAYESFGVHARTLYDFLRNEGTKNDFKAVEFSSRWSPSTNTDFNDLDSFIAHMSKQREVRPKLSLSKLQELGGWLDRQWKKWVEQLSEQDAEALSAAPVCVPRLLLNGVTQGTACTVFTVARSEF